MEADDSPWRPLKGMAKKNYVVKDMKRTLNGRMSVEKGLNTTILDFRRKGQQRLQTNR